MTSSRSPFLAATLAGLAGLAGHASAADTTPAPATAPSVEARLAELDQQVRILQRKAEIDEEAAAARAKAAASPAAGDKGFTLTSADKEFSLKIGGYVQADGRFFVGDDQKLNTDQLLIRRARPVLSGNLGQWIEYRLMPDFANAIILTDAYVVGRIAPEFQVTVGQFKPPLGLERLRSGTALTFLERGYPTNLVPNRDVGLQVGGDVGTYASWQLGIFDGAPDGSTVTGDVNDDKDGVARIWLTPFAGSGSYWFGGLGVGVGASVGYDTGTPGTTNLGTQRSIGQATIFAWQRPAAGQTLANTVVPDGRHVRLSPQLFWAVGPASLLAEYVVSNQDLSLAGRVETVRTTAWQGQLGWILTGEDASWKGVRPKRPFAPGNGGIGAWEVAVRATGIDYGDAFDAGFANAATSVRKATTLGGVLGWYATANLRWQLDAERTVFDGGGVPVGSDRDTENVVSTRVQFSF